MDIVMAVVGALRPASACVTGFAEYRCCTVLDHCNRSSQYLSLRNHFLRTSAVNRKYIFFKARNHHRWESRPEELLSLNSQRRQIFGLIANKIQSSFGPNLSTRPATRRSPDRGPTSVSDSASFSSCHHHLALCTPPWPRRTTSSIAAPRIFCTRSPLSRR